MRPILYTLGVHAAGGTAVIAALQAGTASTPLTLVGVAGGVLAPFVNDVARTVTVTSAGDDSANRFLIWGAGTKGNEIYESLQGTSGSVVESRYVFTKIYSVTPEFDTAANVSVGTLSVIPSPWFPLDYIAEDAPVSVSLIAPAGESGVNATIELTMEQLGFNAGDPTRGSWHGTLFDIVHPPIVSIAPTTAITLAVAGGVTEQLAPNPSTGVRFVNTGPITAGSVCIRVVQGVRNVAGW